MEDEQVRQALDRGCDRSEIMAVFDVSRRNTFNKYKRACAYDFPLAAFSRGGRPTDDERPERRGTTTDTGPEEDDDQQRLDVVAEQRSDAVSRTETWGPPEADHDTKPSNGGVEDASTVVSENGADDELRMHLQHVIDLLREVDETRRR